MTGKPGMKGSGLGGARPGAGRPKKLGGARLGAGRPKGSTGNDAGRQPGAVDKQPNPARIIPMAEKWNFAELALSKAEHMLNILVPTIADA